MKVLLTLFTSIYYLSKSSLLESEIIHIPSPIEEIDLKAMEGSPYAVGKYADTINLFLKREDKIHPEFGGNKWRKLKYNIKCFQEGDFNTIVTFGGAFSNHIAATAAICKYHNIPCTGIIRGNYSDPNNPTLIKASQDAMKLTHVSKDAYKLKESSEEVQQILDATDKPYLIPEGGSNIVAIAGVEEMIQELPLVYDHVVVAAGTGTTAAGIIAACPISQVTVVNALRNQSLTNHISGLLAQNNSLNQGNWSVEEGFHFGGFASVTDELISFINFFYHTYNIALDPVYNAKMMYALLTQIREGSVNPGAQVLCIHTGGHQGITAYNYRAGKCNKLVRIMTTEV